MGDVLHLTGPVLVGPDDVRPEVWVVDGRVTFTAPTAAAQTVAGWVLPGLVDAHCHVGLGPDGAVDEATSEVQALADRDAGTLLIRDAGTPLDTHWVDDRDDLPRIIRAGRHIARSRRYLRGFAHELEPETVVAAVAAAHEEGARTTAHCFGEESLYDFAAAGTDCIEHACGLQPESIA